MACECFLVAHHASKPNVHFVSWPYTARMNFKHVSGIEVRDKMNQRRERCVASKYGMAVGSMLMLSLTGCSAFSGVTEGAAGNPISNVLNNLGILQEDTELVRDLDPNVTPQMAQDYLGQYQLDSRHKVFAISPSGAFGVAEGFSSVDDAKIRAVAECEKDLQPGDLGCVVYDVDGVVVFRPPQRVPIIQAN